MELTRYRDSFMRHLRARNLSPRTCAIYDEAMTKFVQTWGDVEITDVMHQHVEMFVDHLFTQRLEPATVHTHFRGVRAFFAWAVDEGVIPLSPCAVVPAPKVPEKEVAVLTPKDVKALVGCNPRRATFTEVRDATICRLFAETGMRLSELGNLQVEDIDLDQGIASVMGKGRRPRHVPFGPATAYMLDRYLRLRAKHRSAETTWLWLGKAGFLGNHGIEQMVRKRGAALGISVHPHQFRHTFAHNWLASGGQEGDLMRLCGWRNREMLNRYGAAAAEERAIEAYRQRVGAAY